MPQFSATSLERLSTCHPDLVRLMDEVIKHYDITIVCGHRTIGQQNEAFANGHSKLKWPFSKHNAKPAVAVDIAPWSKELGRIDWKNVDEFRYMAGFVMGVASQLGILVRWGGRWQTLVDLPHFELVNPSPVITRAEP